MHAHGGCKLRKLAALINVLIQLRMRPTVTAKTDLPPIPAALADVAHIDGPTCAAAGGMSLSSWHELVRTEQAPQPVIRQSRCTRWRMSDIRQWLIERASQQVTATAEGVTARAKKASIAAREPAAVAKAQATKKARIASRDAMAATQAGA